MRPAVDTTNRATPTPRAQLALRVAIAVLTAALLLVGAHAASSGGLGGFALVLAADTSTTTTTTSSTSTTTSTTSLPTPSQEPPAPEVRYVVPATEAEPEAKQLAVDIAYALTTYEPSEDHMEHLQALSSRAGVESLAQASAPLRHTGSWSRGEVIYPQLGGMRNGRASVMVVTRQTVGSGSEPEFSVVRTLDIRLVREETGWEFDFLDSAGGTFDSPEVLADAHAVASDPRIEMPDSARLDILSGMVSPTLLSVMADLADETPYGVVVLATGHPPNVFETDRQSHHTIGQAVDIYRIGDDLIVDDRGPDSGTLAICEWLYDHPDVHQVGSPWDLDGEGRRSFTDAVHQDHIHLAVANGA